ncbi:hypothetical protein [Anaeromassilibacillus senegalensis]|uniref:hypothetical protein n=1 Tax=Anaeromassilibacillus senegalensis TaxID=1673717 RepID=UPI00068373BC|nr:hypothetical protein [Anaeromassilibacillus senegalensis]
MKKIFSLILAAGMLLCTVSCGETAVSPSSAPPSSRHEAESSSTAPSSKISSKEANSSSEPPVSSEEPGEKTDTEFETMEDYTIGEATYWIPAEWTTDTHEAGFNHHTPSGGLFNTSHVIDSTGTIDLSNDNDAYVTLASFSKSLMKNVTNPEDAEVQQGTFLDHCAMLLHYQNDIYGNSYDMYNLCFTDVNSIYSFSYAFPTSSQEDGEAIFESLTDSLELESVD